MSTLEALRTTHRRQEFQLSGVPDPDDPGVQLGRIEPRLWTPELRELTPETSYGTSVSSAFSTT